MDEAATTERMLAFVRGVLALATLVVATKLYYEVQFEYRPMALTLVLVMTYSLVMSLISRHKPNAVSGAAVFSSIIEVLLITALVASTGGDKSPFYLWYVFYIVSVSLRYGLQLSILALAASIVLYTYITTSPVSLSLAGETFIPTFLGSTGFLFILALLFGHMSEKQKSYRAQLAVVNDLGIALSSLSSSSQIEKQLVDQAAQLLQVQKCWFYTWPEYSREESSYWVGDGAPTNDMDLGAWSPRQTLEFGHARSVNNVKKETSLPPYAANALSIASIAAAPLLVHETPVGVLYAVNRLTSPFSLADQRLLDLISTQAAPLLENARLGERLREAAASDERVRIARDLHDNFLQTLAAIKLHLERCSILVEKDPDKAKDAIARTQEVAASGLSEVRSYLADLRLAGPDPERLDEAITRFVEKTASAEGFKAELSLQMNSKLISQEICAAIFQIVRELVNNAAKHAQPKIVSVSLITSKQETLLTVTDDGVGFDVDDARKSSAASGHLGLLGIEERATALGGTVTVSSEPGRGTEVTVRFPVVSLGLV